MGAVDEHAIVVLDEQGKVRWKQVSPEMNVRMQSVLAAVRSG